MKKPEIIIPELNFDRSKLAGLKKEDVEFIIVHHSGVARDQSVNNIHSYHKKVKGWGGIGYHFYIRYSGEIYRGRMLSERGVHTGGNNHNSIGVCLAGNFNIEDVMNRKKQYDSLVHLLKWLLDSEFSLAKIGFHREFTSTSCPGKNFPTQRLLEDLIKNGEEDSKGENETQEPSMKFPYEEEKREGDESKKEKEIASIQRKVNGTFNGEKIEHESYLIDNRTYIPLRALEEWFDEVLVKWNEEKGEYEIITNDES